MRDYLSQEALTEPALRNIFLAPLLGGLFLMFLPAIGFYLVGKALLIHLASKVNRPVTMAAGSAYLTGSPSDDKLSEPSNEFEELKKEIDQKRLDK